MGTWNKVAIFVAGIGTGIGLSFFYSYMTKFSQFVQKSYTEFRRNITNVAMWTLLTTGVIGGFIAAIKVQNLYSSFIKSLATDKK
jgi:hypothetical protein